MDKGIVGQAKKRWLFGIVCVLALLVAIGMIAARIISINETIDYAFREFDEQAGMPVMAEGMETPFVVSVRAYSVVSLYEMLRVVPEYQGDLTISGDLEDAKFLVIRALFSNQDEKEQILSPLYLRACSQTWANGVDSRLYRHLNSVDDVSHVVFAGESVDLLLPYKISKTQFGLNRAWDSLESASYQLVSSVYPTRVFLTLTRQCPFDDVLAVLPDSMAGDVL